MGKKHLTMASRIRDELSELQQAIERIHLGWERARRENDDLYLDSVAFNLHSLYTGLERIFELIAANIDQSKPEGENWHQESLHQMAIEIEMVRPPRYF